MYRRAVGQRVKKMNRKDIVKAGYGQIPDAYLETRHEDSDDVRLLDELFQRLPRRAKVLDAGCGAGVPITRLLSQYYQVTGVDFAEAQLEKARELVPDATYVCQDIAELDFPDGSFDAICSYYAIIHIPRSEHKRVFRQFCRLLKPSGLALLCLGADDLEDDIVDDYLGVQMYWSHYDANTNLELVASSGFELIWSREIADATSPGSSHLFILAQKSRA